MRLPGSPDVVPLAQSITVTGEGTQTVELGAPPAGTTELEIRLTCLTAGTFLTADGASLVCDGSDAGTGEMGWHLAVVAGQHSTVITAGAGERWRLVATYSRVTDTEWGVNADGLTYGVENDRGTPDLVAAFASNGKVGYVYSQDLIEPAPTSLQIGPPTGEARSIPVYCPTVTPSSGNSAPDSDRAPARAQARDRGVTGPSPSPQASWRPLHDGTTVGNRQSLVDFIDSNDDVLRPPERQWCRE